MNKSVVTVLALAIVFSLLCFTNNRPTAAERVLPVVPQWEYTSIAKSLEDFESATKLNEWLAELGKEGWELCDCVSLSQSRQCVFKRPKK